jgi:hypothetical protein
MSSQNSGLLSKGGEPTVHVAHANSPEQPSLCGADAPATYPGEIQLYSGEAEAFAVKRIPPEPMARHSPKGNGQACQL